MTAERHARLSWVFLAVIERPPPERAAFLERSCGSDVELRRAVEALLARDDRPARIDQPVAGSAVHELLDRAQLAVESVPAQIGRYKILGVLGHGGMGTVFRAEQSQPRRPVALKVLNAALVTTELLHRFEFEAAVLARLTNPGIAQIYEADVVREQGRRVPYFAMELVEGQPLTAYAGEHALDVRQRLALLLRVCEAVSHAHQKGVIHRDLKPANILVDGQGRPKILDFGVAALHDDPVATRYTRAGQIVGTLPYMSPEQVAGDPAQIDTRNDVYALGVITFELLAGRPPYELSGRSLTESIDFLRSAEPPRLGTIQPALRGDLETIVAKALERSKERRYASVAALAADIERYLRDEPILARPPSRMYQLRKFAERNRMLVGSALVVALVLTAGVLTTAWQAIRATRSEARATQLAARESDARGVAESEAQKAIEIRTFLQSLLTSASQGKGRGANFTVREALDEAAGRIETEFAGFPEIRLELQTTIGEGYKGLGLHAQAEPHLRASLETRRALLGPDHPDLVQPLWQFALTLRYLGKYEECEALLREAHSIAVAQGGPESQQAAALLGSIGLLRAKLGDAAEAGRLLDECLSVGGTKPIKAQITAQIRRGAAYCLESDWAGAEAAYREALALHEVAGTEGAIANKTFILNRLACVLQAQEKWADAIVMFRAVLERQVHAVGEDAPRVLFTRVRLATCLYETGETDAALRLADETRRDLCAEPAKPTVVEASRKLGHFYQRAGDPERAEALFRQCLAIGRALPDEPELLFVAQDLAGLLIGNRRESEAEAVLRELVGALGDGVLAQHPQMAVCRQLWGDCLRRQGRYAEAESLSSSLRDRK